jgi:hypothetical protein
MGWALVPLAMLTTSSLPCRAQVEPAGTPEQSAARQVFAQGNALLAAGDYTGALERFRAAYDRWKNPKILVNTGTTLVALGRYAEAADTYEVYLRHPEAEASRREEIEQALHDAEARSALLRVEVNEVGATVMIDGRRLEGDGTAPVRVDPGPHAVIVQKQGRSPTARPVVLEAGQRVVLKMYFAAAQAAPPRTDPPGTPPATAGSGFVLPAVFLGVGGVSLAASATFFAVRAGAVSDLHAACLGSVCPDSARSTIDRASRMGTYGSITLAAGVVSAGVGLSLLLLRRPSASPPAAPVSGLSLQVGPGSALLLGSF